MSVTGFFHAGVTVSDMETALRFYRDGLGLEVLSDGPASGATTSAPIARRTRTTAPGDQPASSSPRASDPESPNDSADATAKPRPIPTTRVSCPMPAMANDSSGHRVTCQRVVRL